VTRNGPPALDGARRAANFDCDPCRGQCSEQDSNPQGREATRS
jgi:hypothetical protein